MFLFPQDQSVSFACKQALMRLIHKHWHGMGNSTPRCNTPTGEGVGGDDFDGEDDDGDQDRANETPPEESNGADAEGAQTGRQPDAEAPEVTHLYCIYQLCATWTKLISFYATLGCSRSSCSRTEPAIRRSTLYSKCC